MTEDDPLVRALFPLVKRTRNDVTAVRKPTGEMAWTSQPLTKAHLVKHLTTGPHRGVGFIKAGQNVTLVGALDLDSHKGATPLPEMLTVARRIADTAELFGLRAVPFLSRGGKGVHLYFVFDEPQDAYTLRATLVDVLAVCGFKNGTKGVAQGEVEVFPKQDAVPHDGHGNQMILPLAGESRPLAPSDTGTYAVLGREQAIGMPWPASDPQPTRQREVGVLEHSERAVGTVSLDTLRSAYAAIPNSGEHELGYDEWYRLVCAGHEGSGGSPDGLEIVLDWSSQHSRHNEKFVRERVWPYIKSDRANGISHRTLLAKAREHGWVQNHALDFENLDEDAGVPDGVDMAPRDYSTIEDAVIVRDSTADDKSVALLETAVEAKAAVEKHHAREGVRPNFERQPRGGKVLANTPNLMMACARPEIIGGTVAYDTFRDEVMINEAGNGQWRAFANEDYTYVLERLEARRIGFLNIDAGKLRGAILATAHRNRFDSAQLWLNGLKWDDVPRVETFLSAYFGAVDSAYTRAVSCYLWTALAGRVLVPGVKADMVPIAIGRQGAGKSTGVAAMVPGPEFFTSISFAERDDDQARKMRGRLIAEFGELRGMRTKEIQAIRDFVSRQHEQWVPKYLEFATHYPRRLLFFGTTNEDRFLADDHGNRRWLPFESGVVDVLAISRDRDQLWAEAAATFKVWGVRWLEAQTLALPYHEKHELGDLWDDAISGWLHKPEFEHAEAPINRSMLPATDILRGALNLELSQIGRREDMRLASCMRRLGYSKDRKSVNGIRCTVYLPNVPNLAEPKSAGLAVI